MDEKIHSIEKLLFVLLKRHTAFNGQFSIGVHRRFSGREFAPSGDKPRNRQRSRRIDMYEIIVLERSGTFQHYFVRGVLQ